LSAVIERCLKKDRNHRYPDAGHLLTALDTAGMAADRSLPFVAVLPFVNVSADPENEYFCDGLSEEILNLLAGARDLRVIRARRRSRGKANRKTSVRSAQSWAWTVCSKAACAVMATA